jgi:hypothetical protein
MSKLSHILFLCVLSLAGSISLEAHAKMITFGMETEVVSLVYGSSTLFRFPGVPSSLTGIA